MPDNAINEPVHGFLYGGHKKREPSGSRFYSQTDNPSGLFSLWLLAQFDVQVTQLRVVHIARSLSHHTRG